MTSGFPETPKFPIPESDEEYFARLSTLKAPTDPDEVEALLWRTHDDPELLQQSIDHSAALLGYAYKIGDEKNAHGVLIDLTALRVNHLLSKADEAPSEEANKNTLRAAAGLVDYTRRALPIDAEGQKTTHLLEAEGLLVDAICSSERFRQPYDLRQDTNPKSFLEKVTKRISAFDIDPTSREVRSSLIGNFVIIGGFMVDSGILAEDKSIVGQGVTLLNAGEVILGQESDELLEEHGIERAELKEKQIDGKAALFALTDIDPLEFH